MTTKNDDDQSRLEPSERASESAQRGDVSSKACDIVIAAEHPSPENGGPCHGCAFRRGTVANRDEITQTMIRMCVEGFRTFDCHMKPGLCRGYVAAANLRGVPATAKESAKADVWGLAADMLSDEIEKVKVLRG